MSLRPLYTGIIEIMAPKRSILKCPSYFILSVKSNKNDIVDNLHEPFVEKGLISNKIRAIFFENKIYNF